MKTKQLIAALLALLLALSLPAASAAESPAPDAGGLINVIVPSTGHMVINPYRLAVRPDGVETTAQLVHAPQALTNLSDFPVTVNVTATASLPRESEAVFVHAPPAPDAKDKEVFLYAEFQERPDWWEGAYRDLPNQLPVSPRGASAGNVLTLDAQGEGWFRLFGALAPSPASAWSDTDTFGAVLTFTFAPLYPDPEPVEEPEAPEEEVPEDPETPDIPEEAPPEDSETPDVPEEVPPEAPLPPDAPEEDPPEEITPPDATEEDPAPPDGAPPEDPGSPDGSEPPAPPPGDPVPPGGEEDDIPGQTMEDQAKAWSSPIFYTPTGSPVKYLRSKSKTWLAAADRTRSRPRPFPQESFWQTVPSAEARAM